MHFQGFSMHGQGSLEGHQRDISWPSHPSTSGWSGQSSPGNEVTLTLWEVNRAETPKPNQGIFSGVGMMQPCCCGDFPGFPGKLNSAFPWWDENLGPTTHTAGPHTGTPGLELPQPCLKTCPAAHPQNVPLSPSCWTLDPEVGDEFLGWAGACGKHREKGQHTWTCCSLPTPVTTWNQWKTSLEFRVGP